MNFEKPSLYQEYLNRGDVRTLSDYINRFQYTIEEVSEVINFYEPDEFNKIPEVEHIETLLTHYQKKINISYFTLRAIKNSFPKRFPYIVELNYKKKVY
jgi:hypothetical protein